MPCATSIIGCRRTVIALVLLLAFYGLALNGLLEGGDAERYAIFGRSMAERGDVILLSHPNEPAGERYGPSYPALIGFFFLLFGYSIYAAKLASLLPAVFAAYATYLLVRELSDEKTAILVSLLFAVSPQMLQYSHNIMTESTFTLFSILALLFVVRHAKNPKNGINLPAAAFFIAASALTKSGGMVLLAAVVLHYLLGRDLKSATAVVFLFVVFMIPWYLRNLHWFGSPLHSDYGGALDLSAYGGAGGAASALTAFSGNLWAWVEHVIPENIFPPLYLVNLKNYSIKLFLAGALAPIFSALDSEAARIFFAAAGLLVSAVMFYGALKRTKNVGAHDIYFAGYIAFFALFFVFATDPLRWLGERDSPRFVIPILPLAFYYFIAGIGGLSHESKKIIYGVAALILLSSLAVDGVLILKARQGFYIPQIESQWKAGEWARDNTPKDSVFMMAFSKGFYWHSGRKVVDLESDLNLTLETAIRDYGVGYVVAEPDESRLELDRDCLTEVYRTPEPTQIVYRVDC